MIQAFSIVAPIFALIGLGYGAARLGHFTAQSRQGVAHFAFAFAIPALLFRTIAGSTGVPIEPIPIWIAYFGTVAIIWCTASLVTRFVLGRPQQDAASIAMTSSYGNVVMLGIPLAVSLLGPGATTPIAVILAAHTPLMWIAGTLHLHLAERAARGAQGPFVTSLLRDLWHDVSRNILLIAIFAGAVWRLTGLGLNPTIDATLNLLAQAGIPCALVALGASLADFEIKGQIPTLSTVLVLKLLVMPAVAVVLAVKVLDLPPIAATVVILFAAMPAGANAYLFANRYGRAVNSASGAVALGTLLAVLTSSLLAIYFKA